MVVGSGEGSPLGNWFMELLEGVPPLSRQWALARLLQIEEAPAARFQAAAGAGSALPAVSGGNAFGPFCWVWSGLWVHTWVPPSLGWQYSHE